MKKEFVILKEIGNGNKFFTTNSGNEKETVLCQGKVAYHILGYADTIEEAQIFLYGRSYPFNIHNTIY